MNKKTRVEVSFLLLKAAEQSAEVLMNLNAISESKNYFLPQKLDATTDVYISILNDLLPTLEKELAELKLEQKNRREIINAIGSETYYRNKDDMDIVYKLKVGF